MIMNPQNIKMPSAVESEPEGDRKSTSGANDDNISNHMNQQHSEKEWDAMYPHIVRLYLGEQLKLSEVMRIMEVRYMFRATQSMYKKRISRWQLHKYKRRARSTAGPTPSIEADDSPATSRASSSARRPTSESLPPQVADPEMDSPVQALLVDMRRLSLMPNASSWGSSAEHPDEVRLAPSGIHDYSQMYMAFSLGSTLFLRGHGQLAGKAVRKAFLKLEDVIKDGHFGLGWITIDILYDFASRRQHELYTAFVTHLANMAHVLLPPHHPLHRIAEQLLHHEHDERGEIVTLLQREYFHQIEASSSDPQLQTLITRQNRPVRDALMTYEGLDADIALVIRGIRAVRDEFDMQNPSPPASPDPSAAAARSPPPTPAFSQKSSCEGREMMLLSKFIEEQAKHSMARMKYYANPLELGGADSLYFMEYSPDLVDLYKLRGAVRQSELEGDWFGAIQAERVVIEMLKDKWPADRTCLIRELWALMRMLESAGVAQEQTDAVNSEALAVVRDLLKDIPDDTP
ncbi:hypothetical protein F5Y18DRAFT_132438 [Xylariaceae sp. FL1019]|nr:hypothetical protein F5Y18DRAFT_132438 [Xylariaceae sp. FL1019]